VTLINVDAPDGSARRLQARLQTAGYHDVRIVNGDRHPQARTTLAGSGAAAARLLAELGYGERGGAQTPGAALTVRLGADSK
jgi:polyisoprenyl-teichoic acid--peptidoglycan teichoic acid transferase